MRNDGGYFMKKQLQGISFILFGIILILFSMINPWVPILGDAILYLCPWLGILSGIIGLAFSFGKED